MVLMKTCLASPARSRASSLALCLSLALALSMTAPASAQAPASPAASNSEGDKPAASGRAKPKGNPIPAKSSASNAAEDDDEDDKDDKDDDKAKGGTPEERLARRRERLEQGAKRLRERAAEVRKRIAAGETAGPQPPNSKRPPRSLEEQAERYEKQAERMETRAKNLTADNVSGSAERSPEYARQRRHQLRRSHLNRRWGGPTLRDPEAATELKVHAERVARLKRIRSLAMEKSKDDPLAKRAKELLNKEEDRHEQRMKSIQARVAPAPAGDTPAATTAPAATEATK